MQLPVLVFDLLLDGSRLERYQTWTLKLKQVNEDGRRFPDGSQENRTEPFNNAFSLWKRPGPKLFQQLLCNQRVSDLFGVFQRQSANQNNQVGNGRVRVSLSVHVAMVDADDHLHLIR